MPALIPIAASVAAAVVSRALAPKPPKAPEPLAPPKPEVMPLPDDLAAQQAKRKSLAEQITRRGRASTILTEQSDKLGAGT